MKMLKRLSAILLVTWVSAAGAATRETASRPIDIPMRCADGKKIPEVWTAALYIGNLPHRPEEWKFVLENIDGFKFWSGHIDTEPDPILKAFGSLSNEYGFQLSSERMYWPSQHPKDAFYQETYAGTSGPFDETYGKRAAVVEIKRLQKMQAAGGTISYVDLDGTYRNLIHPDFTAKMGGGFSPEDATREIISYMKDVVAAFPDVKFFELVNFPLWSYKGVVAYNGTEILGDYFPLLERLIKATKEAKLPLVGVTMDNPYEYAMGTYIADWTMKEPGQVDWMKRILDVETYVRSQGLEFNLILNSEKSKESISASNENCLKFLDAYYAAGGRPDRYIVQSWWAHPTADELLPESNPQTHMGLTLEVIKRVKGVNP